MTSKRNAKATVAITPGRAKARREIATCLVQALAETKTSQESASRAMGVGKRTVGAWLREETAVTVEAVIASPRLAKAFRQALCVHEHEPLAYLAKKASR